MIELTPRLDPMSDEALYMQLYRYLGEQIANGRIPTGSRLPSVRRLSEHLGISRTPVSLAYEQLLAEGYIHSKPRSGYYASELDRTGMILPADTRSPNGLPAAARLSRPYHAFGSDQTPFDFGYGSVDLESFPLNKWRKWMNRCLLPENQRLLLYGELQGEAGLRLQIASYLHQVRGVRCVPEQIVIGAGTYHSLELLLQLLNGDVDCMAAEEFVNDGVKALFKQFRLACRPLKLESDGIRVEELFDSRARAVYVTPSHQFPFGMVLSVNKRIKLLNWAKERQAYIIENDYDGEFRYHGRPIPSLQGLDEDGRVVYVGTFSRTLAPSFRLSYLVLPPKLLDRFFELKHSYDQLASPIFQKTLQLFMESGEFGRHMRKMRRLYHKKHDALLQEVARAFGGQADVIGAGSGLHVLLKVRNGMSERQLIEAAKESGVLVYPASVYALAPGRAEDSTVLLGFGGLTEAGIAEGVGRLAKAWGICPE